MQAKILCRTFFSGVLKKKRARKTIASHGDLRANGPLKQFFPSEPVQGKATPPKGSAASYSKTLMGEAPFTVLMFEQLPPFPPMARGITMVVHEPRRYFAMVTWRKKVPLITMAWIISDASI
jgi:hypothetical protein